MKYVVKISTSIEFQAGLPIIGDSKVKTRVEGSWKFSETTQTVTVPPHKSHEVSTLVLRGSLDVPYQAVVTYIHPDGSTTDVTSKGIFTGTNGYTVITNQRELGQTTHKRKRAVISPPVSAEASAGGASYTRRAILARQPVRRGRAD